MNVALRLKDSGLDVRLLTRVGKDHPGSRLREYLVDAGLPARFIQIDDRWRTGEVVLDTSNPHAVRYDIAEPAAWDFIDADAYLQHAEKPPDVLVYGSLAARNEVSRAALMRLLKEPGLKVFDVNLRPPFAARATVEALLEQSDWVKINEGELEEISAWLGVHSSPAEAAKAIKDCYELDVVCVTFGGEGAMLWYADTCFRQPAFDVAVIDTVGCGDAFLGSLIASLLGGELPANALARASAIGALVASTKGASPVISEAAIGQLLTAR